MKNNPTEYILGQWPRVASSFLNNIGHPLRPINEDIELYRSFLRAEEKQRQKALVLGVTPELYALTMGSFSETFAIDRTREMIEFIWPGESDHVFNRDWLELGTLGLKFDAILCDGGLHLLRYPHQQAALASAIDSSLLPGGRFITRLFTPPVEPEDFETVISALKRGEIPSMNHLKVRLANALQENAHSGVRLADVWSELDQGLEERETFFKGLGWNSGQVNVVDLYRNSDARYSFVAVEQVISLFSKYAPNLKLVGTEFASYFMANQFPLVCFEKPS